MNKKVSSTRVTNAISLILRLPPTLRGWRQDNQSSLSRGESYQTFLTNCLSFNLNSEFTGVVKPLFETVIIIKGGWRGQKLTLPIKTKR